MNNKIDKYIGFVVLLVMGAISIYAAIVIYLQKAWVYSLICFIGGIVLIIVAQKVFREYKKQEEGKGKK